MASNCGNLYLQKLHTTQCSLPYWLSKLWCAGANAILYIPNGIIKHVVSPHRTRICGFFFAVLSNYKNNASGQSHMCFWNAHFETMLCCFHKRWRLSSHTALLVKLVIAFSVQVLLDTSHNPAELALSPFLAVLTETQNWLGTRAISWP